MKDSVLNVRKISSLPMRQRDLKKLYVRSVIGSWCTNDNIRKAKELKTKKRIFYMIKNRKNIFNQTIIQLIKLYQILLSPDHSFWARALGKHHCRYYPTCSMYGRECFEKYAFWKAIRLTLWRIVRCNPLSKGGLDPVPDIEPGKCNHNHSKK